MDASSLVCGWNVLTFLQRSSSQEAFVYCHFALPGLSAPAAMVAEALKHPRVFDEQLEHPILDESPQSYSLDGVGDLARFQ